MGIEIDLERDSLLGEVSRKRLRESYMKEEEQSPQERFATVAETFASNPAHAQRIYDYASKHWLSFSTPILSFGRSKKGLPIKMCIRDRYNIRDQYKVIAMSRPRSDNPKEHTSIIRAKRKDGWTYGTSAQKVGDML